jgi:hypothetical protein
LKKNGSGYKSPSKSKIKSILEREETIDESLLPSADLFKANSHIYKTADKRLEENFLNDPNNSSFRVENRKARPKIIKNINNICNIFIF